MNTIVKRNVKEIDRDFAQNLRILSKVSFSNNYMAKYCTAKSIELYIRKKIDLELTNSFNKIFQINHI